MDILTSRTKHRGIIEIPIRHGKSVYYSHLLPSWLGMVNPTASVGLLSYNEDTAVDWNFKNRQLIERWGPQLTGVSVDQSFRSKRHFKMAAPYGGDHRGIGIWGGLSGKGFHVMVWDDLVKDMTHVATESMRENLMRHIGSELMNRAEEMTTKIFVVMSRRHPQDVSGSLLEMNSSLPPQSQWHSIKFKALDDDGLALWPGKWNAEYLRGWKQYYEERGEPWSWYGLFQQDPSAAGEMTEWPARYFQEPFLYDERPPFQPVLRLLALDPSKGEDARKGDYSALLYGLLAPDGVWWIEDPKMLRIDATELTALSAQMVAQYRPDAFAIEANGFQEVLANNIHAACEELCPGACPIYPYQNTRAEAVAALRKGLRPGESARGRGKEVDIRMILTPVLNRHGLRICNTPQGRLLKRQLVDFPVAEHDDGPDALTMLIRLFQDMTVGSAG